MTNYSRSSKAKFLLRRRFKPEKLLYSLFAGPNPYRRLTSRGRMSPDFLIIGAMRAGSTSLYRLLMHHPDILPPLRKEIYYFDQNYQKGKAWYHAHFPLSKMEPEATDGRQIKQITGEASPYYLQDALTPERVKDTYPEIKLLAILRNPIDRAYSNYWQQVRWGYEKRSIEEVFRTEMKDLNNVPELSKITEKLTNYDTLHYSYISRGLYIFQLERWLMLFSPAQILVLISEDFFSEVEHNLPSVFSFLGVSPGSWFPPEIKHFNKAQYPPMQAPLREELIHFYRLHNQRLADLIGVELNWDH